MLTATYSWRVCWLLLQMFCLLVFSMKALDYSGYEKLKRISSISIHLDLLWSCHCGKENTIVVFKGTENKFLNETSFDYFIK